MVVSPEKEIMITLRLSKVPNSQSMMIGSVTTYTVCETCMIDTAHESIVFPFIFIVKFSDRLQCDFFSGLGTGTGSIFQPFEQKWFQWCNLFSIFRFFGWSPYFVDICLVIGLFHKKTKMGGGRGWGHKFFISLLYPRKFHKIMLGLSEVRRSQKPRPLPWKFHIVFSWSPLDGNSSSFLVNPWKF